MSGSPSDIPGQDDDDELARWPDTAEPCRCVGTQPYLDAHLPMLCRECGRLWDCQLAAVNRQGEPK
jgi:hypothetical protein